MEYEVSIVRFVMHSITVEAGNESDAIGEAIKLAESAYESGNGSELSRGYDDKTGRLAWMDIDTGRTTVEET